MKRTILVVISLIILTIGCTTSGSRSVSNEQDTLDSELKNAADYLNTRIPPGSTVAFVNIAGGYPDLANYILNDLSRHAVNAGLFSVVDRARLDDVRAELNLNMSGEVSDSSAQAVGNLLGAQTIVSGSVQRIGEFFRLDIKAIEVQTATVQGQWAQSIPNRATITALTENVSVDGSATIAFSESAASSGTASGEQTPVSRVYRIGDIGPANGFIFYDKGNNIGGWRYLEAAPPETEISAVTFSPAGFNELVGNRRVGDGKENTIKFIELFNRVGGGINTAPWICNELSVNGFDDWYLPSLDEVLLMYNNLYLRGLGGFINSRYWSSYVNGWWYTFCVNFSNGSEERPTSPNSTRYQVRAVRRF